MKDLHHAVIVEQIFLRNHPFQSTHTKKPVGHGNRKIHQYSKSVVSVYGAASRVPIHVTGDGNCLSNSVSVVVQGKEALASEFFMCFNAMQFIFGQVLGHGTTNIKISFSKLAIAMVTMLITP